MQVSSLHLSSPFCGDIREISAKNSDKSISNFSRSCMNMLNDRSLLSVSGTLVTTKQIALQRCPTPRLLACSQQL